MTILQYCSVCKTEYEMEIVPTADDDGVLWLQCPACKGFLPKVKSVEAPAANEPVAEPKDEAVAEPSVDTPDETQVTDDTPSPVAEDSEQESTSEKKSKDDQADDTVDDADEGAEQLAAMDVSLAVPYRPWQQYVEGDVIHHLAWDDYGVVLAKEVLPGHRRVVKVRFAQAGIVRLIEDQGERPR